MKTIGHELARKKILRQYSPEAHSSVHIFLRDIQSPTRWTTRQELLELDFLEADRGLVKDLAAGKIL